MRETDERGTGGLQQPLRQATKADGRAVAELIDLAGHGIPGYLWSRSAKAGQSPIEVGVERVSREDANFSYRNAVVAEVDGRVAAMMLAYRLPEQDDVDLDELPDLLRPLVELELKVPGSFYINALAAYPEYRGLGLGTRLLEAAHTLASEAGCEELSLEVFDQNEGAVRLYERHGYRAVARLPVVPHPSYPYDGDVVLMAQSVSP
ncbi:MAG: GNAT family N-acetyltransferase [Rubrobacter sp.]|nr:GNAT family N-acetyltransferase [Rubrobacter sp.]